MVQEAEKYADEDKATKERIEARNGLENYAFSLKNQVNDEEGLGGKIDEDDKETVSLIHNFPNIKTANRLLTCCQQILEAVKETTEWLDTNAATAEAADFEEQKEKLSGVAYPITSKLYGDAGAGGAPGGDDEPADHDEL